MSAACYPTIIPTPDPSATVFTMSRQNILDAFAAMEKERRGGLVMCDADLAKSTIEQVAERLTVHFIELQARHAAVEPPTTLATVKPYRGKGAQKP